MNSLQKFYSSFSGVQSRPNKLQEDPASFRKGTKNLRYNFQDELTQCNGYQHKDAGAAVELVDTFEYKYVDINTGQPKVQVLGVGIDGNLYKRTTNTLRFTSHGVATSCSLYYDDIANDYKFVMAGLGTITLSVATTMNALRISLNALAGVVVDIVDDDGASVLVSSIPAYFLDCVIENDFEDNSVYSWSLVYYGGTAAIDVNLRVPFNTTKKYYSDSNYEGISSVNYENSIVITDGGFPMKYDGKTVYRFGIFSILRPKLGDLTANYSGMSLLQSPGGALTALNTYRYYCKAGFVDYNGVETLGMAQTNELGESLQYTLTGVNNALTLGYALPALGGAQDFPIYSCVVNGNQNIATAGGTFNVTSHNLEVGMLLRIPLSNAPVGFGGYSFIMTKITALTSTTVTVAIGYTGGIYPLSTGAATLLVANQVINGGYCVDTYANKITDVDATALWNPEIKFGAFIRVYRTIGNAQTGLAYRLYDLPISFQTGSGIAQTDILSDATGLSRIPMDTEEGQELARACKYLTSWQNQLAQAGRTPNPSYATMNYPMAQTAALFNNWGYAPNSQDVRLKYTEAGLCDFQSVYWNDSLNPEGFPQDGLHEFFVNSAFDDKIKGIAENKDTLFALKERSTGVISGDLALNNLALEMLETDAGCVSHRTIATVKGSLIWLDELNGFFSCVAGRLPENIGYPIADYQKINEESLNYNTAHGVNFQQEDLYICYVGSTAFVFDYSATKSGDRNCWYVWTSDNINFKSILALSTDEFFGYDGTRSWKMKTTGTDYDYSNYQSAIDFFVKTAWQTKGEPSIDKHYLALWINSIQGNFTLDVYQYANFLEDQTSVYTDLEFIDETPSKKFIKASVKAAIPKLSGISFGMRNQQINKTVKIQGYEIQLNADFDKGEPKR